jgi:septal ring factor EnvC (AmiA/AmiB activator)
VSIVADPVASAPVNELKELLRTGAEGYERLLNELFDDMEGMCRSLDEERQRCDLRCRKIESEKQQLTELLNQRQVTDGNSDPVLQTKVTELEHDRQALEEELEEVRSRAADLAKTVTEQKRQMADERAEWTAELRQLRRVLDKQATWIAQQSQQPAGLPVAASEPASGSAQLMSNQSPMAGAGNYPPTAPPATSRDPVLGSVLSQFELLRKDLERRRAPPKIGGTKNVNAS